MTTQEFEQIKKKLSTLETSTSKLEGAFEGILSTLNNKYGISSTKELLQFIEKTRKSNEELTTAKENVSNELLTITDWSKL